MKPKKHIISRLWLAALLLFAVAVLVPQSLFAQDVDARLNEARDAYRSGKHEEARFALQQALNELDLAIGKEILALMPEKMGNLPASGQDDNVGSASLGFAGLFVSRVYRADAEKPMVEVSLIGDSPLLAGINTILALPSFGSDPNQKRIRLSGYRGLLQKTTDDSGEVSWDIQLAFGSSLVSMNFRGIPEEKTVMDMAGTIPFDRIARLVQ